MSEWNEETTEYVQAIADTKLLLSHRYAEWMLAGPSLEDDIGGASAAQDEVGHVRQLFRELEQQGSESEWLEGDRSPEEFNNAATLDTESESWEEFLVTVATTDRAVWYMLDSITSNNLEGMISKIGEDEYFHLDYHDAKLLTLAEDDPESTQSMLETALPKVLAFIGPSSFDSESDPVVQAGFTDRSAAELREAVLAHYEDLFAETDVALDSVDRLGPSVEEWNQERRRVGNGGIDQSVIDSLVGVRNKEFAAE